MTVNDPFHRLPEVPSFTVTSTTVADGGAFAPEQHSGLFGVPGGRDLSPQLSWSGAPEETQSYVVSMYDPDAPTGSGFWHWVVTDIPSTVTDLAEGAGDEGGDSLPSDARQFRTDAGLARFIGAAPPAGHGQHRYYLVVSALDIERLDLPDDASPAYVGLTVSEHIVARAHLVATAEIAPLS